MSERRFSSVADEADRAMLMRLSDITDSSAKWSKPCFSSFLNEHEQAMAEQYRLVSQQAFFYGGFEGAQRRVFCALPDGYDRNSLDASDYPFTALTILLPKGYNVSHRDILGSLMALRIKREAVGDILVGDCLAVIFLLAAAASLAMTELEKIGSVGVKCVLGAPPELPDAYKTEEHEGVVSSLRLDGIVSMLTDVSRSESARLITQGLVARNAQVASSASKEVEAGDRISIRGFGKYEIGAVGGLTKKGRLHITYKKYI